MLIKEGVVHEGVHWRIGYALAIANRIWALHGKDLVWVSGREGRHSLGSFHPLGLAADLRTHYFNTDTIKEVAAALRTELPKGYDVVVEKHHIHMEYDPKEVQR